MTRRDRFTWQHTPPHHCATCMRTCCHPSLSPPRSLRSRPPVLASVDYPALSRAPRSGCSAAAALAGHHRPHACSARRGPARARRHRGAHHSGCVASPHHVPVHRLLHAQTPLSTTAACTSSRCTSSSSTARSRAWSSTCRATSTTTCDTTTSATAASTTSSKRVPRLLVRQAGPIQLLVLPSAPFRAQVFSSASRASCISSRACIFVEMPTIVRMRCIGCTTLAVFASKQIKHGQVENRDRSHTSLNDCSRSAKCRLSYIKCHQNHTARQTCQRFARTGTDRTWSG